MAPPRAAGPGRRCCHPAQRMVPTGTVRTKVTARGHSDYPVSVQQANSDAPLSDIVKPAVLLPERSKIHRGYGGNEKIKKKNKPGKMAAKNIKPKLKKKKHNVKIKAWPIRCPEVPAS